jgi:thiol-disulfide isomerase/thioredoxin
VTRLLRGVLVVLVLLLLASCTPSATPSQPTDAAEQSRVDMDTPALRTLKARAGVAPCVAAASDNQLPAVSLPCLGGGPEVDLARLRGPLVVNLFAQWCGPCREELPYYQALHEKAAGRVAVLGVDYLDTRPDLALELVRRSGVTYPLVADPAGTLRAGLRVVGLPGIVLVGRDGSVHVEYRAFRSYAELRALVQRRLGVALPA